MEGYSPKEGHASTVLTKEPHKDRATGRLHLARDGICPRSRPTATRKELGMEGTRTALEQPGQRKLQKVNVTIKLRSDRKVLTVYTRDSLLHAYRRALEIQLVQNEISSECKTYIVLMTS